jgi:hypothetical protein
MECFTLLTVELLKKKFSSAPLVNMTVHKIIQLQPPTPVPATWTPLQSSAQSSQSPGNGGVKKHHRN